MEIISRGGIWRDNTAKSRTHARYQMKQSLQLHGNVSQDEPGHIATASDTCSITHMHKAERLLNNAPIGGATIEITIPAAPKTTEMPANGTTTIFATRLPNVILPNTLARIGALAIHAAHEMPNAPSSQLPLLYQASNDATR